MRVSNDDASLLRVFAARQIATAISEAEFVDHAEAPGVAHERLTTRRFDQAPVTQDGRLVGWVSTSTLKAANNVKGVLRPLSRSALVSGESPISQVLELLAKDGFVFVVGEGGIDGFVTPSDLDRHAVRSHFYLLVAGIEMLLAEVVRAAVNPDVVLARVHGDVRARWEAAYAANSETSPVEYLYLQDLAELFLSHSAEGASPWDKRLSDKLTAICQFRPTVMHPARPLMSGRNAIQLATLSRAAEEVSAALATLTSVSAMP